MILLILINSINRVYSSKDNIYQTSNGECISGVTHWVSHARYAFFVRCLANSDCVDNLNSRVSTASIQIHMVIKFQTGQWDRINLHEFRGTRCEVHNMKSNICVEWRQCAMFPFTPCVVPELWEVGSIRSSSVPAKASSAVSPFIARYSTKSVASRRHVAPPLCSMVFINMCTSV